MWHLKYVSLRNGNENSIGPERYDTDFRYGIDIKADMKILSWYKLVFYQVVFEGGFKGQLYQFIWEIYNDFISIIAPGKLIDIVFKARLLKAWEMKYFCLTLN